LPDRSLHEPAAGRKLPAILPRSSSANALSSGRFRPERRVADLFSKAAYRLYLRDTPPLVALSLCTPSTNSVSPGILVPQIRSEAASTSGRLSRWTSRASTRRLSAKGRHPPRSAHRLHPEMAMIWPTRQTASPRTPVQNALPSRAPSHRHSRAPS